MSYTWLSEYDNEDKIQAILNWAEDDPRGGDFDTDFVKDLSDKLESGFDLSDAQERALDNIISKWNIDLDYFP